MNTDIPKSYRTNVTAADVLPLIDAVTPADVPGLGDLEDETAYYITIAPCNSYGRGLPLEAVSIITDVAGDEDPDTHAIDLTFDAVPGAEYYDVFLSTDESPKLVAHVTAAQLAIGCEISDVGVVDENDEIPGTVRVMVVGTGAAASEYTVNRALVPPAQIFTNRGLRSMATLFMDVIPDDAITTPVVQVAVLLPVHGEWFAYKTVDLDFGDSGYRQAISFPIIGNNVKVVVTQLENVSSVDMYISSWDANIVGTLSV